jgi:hypothetical protein
MAFKLSKEQLTERDALTASLREKAEALNVAIAAFDQVIEPLSKAVREALDGYNGILERARTLASSIAETAEERFYAKSEKWQESDKGLWVRGWIEQWEMSLDDIDLELSEPLKEIDPYEQAGELEDAPAAPK